VQKPGKGPVLAAQPTQGCTAMPRWERVLKVSLYKRFAKDYIRPPIFKTYYIDFHDETRPVQVQAT
jgi:hypothetical protein